MLTLIRYNSKIKRASVDRTRQHPEGNGPVAVSLAYEGSPISGSAGGNITVFRICRVVGWLTWPLTGKDSKATRLEHFVFRNILCFFGYSSMVASVLEARTAPAATYPVRSADVAHTAPSLFWTLNIKYEIFVVLLILGSKYLYRVHLLGVPLSMAKGCSGGMGIHVSLIYTSQLQNAKLNPSRAHFEQCFTKPIPITQCVAYWTSQLFHWMNFTS